jgi:septal ring factor EnvC (AmiA/AmiB activator)
MDNLLFYTLLGLTTYYFMVYLPQKKLSPDPFSSKLTQDQSTQTDPEKTSPDPQIIQNLEREKSQQDQTIANLNKKYEQLENQKSKQSKDSANQIGTLQQQISELKKQLTQLSQSQSQEQQALEQTLDQLIKGMDEVNEILDNS